MLLTLIIAGAVLVASVLVLGWLWALEALNLLDGGHW